MMRQSSWLTPRRCGCWTQRLSFQAGEEVRGGSPAVLREAGQGGQLPGWDVPGLRQPAGAGIGGQRAVSLDLGSGPLCGGGCARGAAGLPVEDGVGLGLERALGFRCRRRRLGMSPKSLAGLGMRYVLDVPGSTPVWPLEPSWDPAWTTPRSQGFGRPRKPRLRDGQSYHGASDELPDEDWREITVAQGSQGPRSYMFCAQRVRVTRKGKPGHEALPPEPGRQRAPLLPVQRS